MFCTKLFVQRAFRCSQGQLKSVNNYLSCLSHASLKTYPESLDSFPNPTKDFREFNTGRDRKSFICDPNNYINDYDAEEIDKLISEAKDEKLAEIGIAIISSLSDYGHSGWYDKVSLSEKYAKSIHTQWGVGQSPYIRDGVLIFATIKDRYMYISTGNYIKGIITDEFIENILIPKELAKYMKKEEYGTAMKIAVEDIIDLLKHDKSHTLHKARLYKQYKRYENSVKIDKATDTFEGVNESLGFWLFVIGFTLWIMSWFLDDDITEKYAKFMKDKVDFNEFVDKLKKDINKCRLYQSCPLCLNKFKKDADILSFECGHRYCCECHDDAFHSNLYIVSLEDEERNFCFVCDRKMKLKSENVEEIGKILEVSEVNKERLEKDMKFRIKRYAQNKEWKDVITDAIMDEIVDIILDDYMDIISGEYEHRHIPGRYRRRRRTTTRRLKENESWSDLVERKQRENNASRGGSGWKGGNVSFGGGSSFGGGGGGGSWLMRTDRNELQRREQIAGINIDSESGD